MIHAAKHTSERARHYTRGKEIFRRNARQLARNSEGEFAILSGSRAGGMSLHLSATGLQLVSCLHDVADLFGAEALFRFLFCDHANVEVFDLIHEDRRDSTVIRFRGRYYSIALPSAIDQIEALLHTGVSNWNEFTPSASAVAMNPSLLQQHPDAAAPPMDET